MFGQLRTLQSPTGATLGWRHWPVCDAAEGILLISHGLAEHSGRYARFAETMARHGFHVYAHDHRGHGESRAPDAQLGLFSQRGGFEKVIADLRHMREMAVTNHPGLPIVLFGHSMGGLIALNAAESDPELYDALAVWNSNFRPGLAGRGALAILAIERMLKGSDVPSPLLSKLTFGAWSKAIADRKTDFDWLSRDQDEVSKYVADPLCGFDASVSLWIDVFELAFAGARSDRLARLPAKLPVHLVGGSADPSTMNGDAIGWLGRRMKARGMTDVTVTIYQGMRHETLNEIGRETATEDFVRWCLEAVGAESRAIERM
ncbi:alpha-beta hydrolase superfamily lysophospholipase [Sinorhizobium fredii]|uniref:Hydrolase, alpha/beta fold family n=1 Tax=Sinorhizobium fredii (strain USDA 257) TaxID=1185652 RepID=I3XB09_SINF2|nr:alpha/beta hydrolase [Sinorhizobium fredii]AFL53065.1 hydrolase, alpha/beta fold family [Sinorhizobium fredii USDA 257]